jgi:hypothetical protein
VIVDCLFPWPAAKQNDEMVERHNLQQQSAPADSVAHSAWEYCQTAIYCILSLNRVKMKESAGAES